MFGHMTENWTDVHSVTVSTTTNDNRDVTATTVTMKVNYKFLSNPGIIPGCCTVVIRKTRHDSNNDQVMLQNVALRRDELDFVIDILENDNTTQAVHSTMKWRSVKSERDLTITRRRVQGPFGPFNVHQLSLTGTTVRRGSVSFVRHEIKDLLVALKGFRDLWGAWEVFNEHEYDVAAQSLALVFWCAFKRHNKVSAVFDYSEFNKLQFFLSSNDKKTVKDELTEWAYLEEPISDSLYALAQKTGMVFLASTVSV